jgi:hypothetical protein
MNTTGLDPVELQQRMRLALDVIMAHRIARGLSLERERVTAIRGLLEERVLMALEETDETTMPASWSWQRAAESISMAIALAIVQEQKNEPPSANP